MKSAPLRKAYRNPSSGWMAPAARTLYAIHGWGSALMYAAVSSGFTHQMLSFWTSLRADQ